MAVDEEYKRTLRDAYSKFRGIPRLCYNAFHPGLSRRDLEKIEEALIAMPTIEQFIRSMRGLMPFENVTSHALVRIEPKGTDYTSTHTGLLSDYRAQRIFEWIRLSQNVAISESITGLLRNPDACGFAGKLFEQAVHRKSVLTEEDERLTQLDEMTRRVYEGDLEKKEY
jgi:hypothetical protein